MAEKEAEKVEGVVEDEPTPNLDGIADTYLYFMREISDLWLFCAGLWFCLLLILLLLIGGSRAR